MIVGPHLSIAKGFERAVKEALSIGANTFQFFTRNPRGGAAKALDREDLSRAKGLIDAHGFGPLLAHAPYTLNLASQKESVRSFGRQILADDLERMKEMPASFYTLHPGAHTGQGVEVGSALIVEALRPFLLHLGKTQMLFETMSGKGTEIGQSFEEIAGLIDALDGHPGLGVCLDTCHVFSAGYDLVEDLEGVLEDFDQTIGLDRLKAIHLNDSLKPRGAKKDRHARLGEGRMGERTLFQLVQHPILKGLPFYLETPNDPAGFADEIRRLKAGGKK